MRKLQKKVMKNNVVEDEKHIVRVCNKEQNNSITYDKIVAVDYF